MSIEYKSIIYKDLPILGSFRVYELMQYIMHTSHELIN